jgi:hypothetical protein
VSGTVDCGTLPFGASRCPYSANRASCTQCKLLLSLSSIEIDVYIVLQDNKFTVLGKLEWKHVAY